MSAGSTSPDRWGTIAVGTNPGAVAFGSDGYAYVANVNDNSVSVINPFGTVVQTIAMASNPTAVAVSPDGQTQAWLPPTPNQLWAVPFRPQGGDATPPRAPSVSDVAGGVYRPAIDLDYWKSVDSENV